MPVPDDDEGRIFIAPQTALDRAAWVRQVNTPIYAPSPEPQQRPLIVSTLADQLARRPLRSPTVPLRDLGEQRYAILDSLGLSDLCTMHARLSTISASDIDALRYGVFDLAKATLDRLLEQREFPEPPLTAWCGASGGARLVGATLFWADHYLVSDQLADALKDGWRRDAVERGLRHAVELRPLVEIGIIVPVLDDLLTILTADNVYKQTEQDLRNAELTRWVIDQLVVEGPTARECILLNAIDDADDRPMYFMYGRIVPGSIDDATRTMSTRMLGPFDPNFDYSRWIEHCRRQTAARFVQETNLDLAVADVVGAEHVTLSPFRARLVEKRGSQPGPAAALVWSEVPMLQGATPAALSQIARAGDAFEALRGRARRASIGMRAATPEDRRARAAELSGDLQAEAERLRGKIERDRLWQQLAPTAVSIGSLALGAVTAGLPGAAGGLLTAALQLGQHRSARRGLQDQAGYALLLGERLAPPRGLRSGVSVIEPTEEFSEPVPY